MLSHYLKNKCNKSNTADRYAPADFFVAAALLRDGNGGAKLQLDLFVGASSQANWGSLRLLPNSCLLADSHGANKSLKRLSRVACDASRPPQPAPPLSSAVRFIKNLL